MKNELRHIKMGFNNCYLLEGDKGFVLVDTGFDEQWGKLENELIAAGCLPDNLKLVIITHGDIDHIGNCAKLQKKYNAKIAIHKGDLDLAQKGNFPDRVVTNRIVKISMLIEAIVDKLKKNKKSIPIFIPDLFLEDNQKLNEYGVDARIIHTPGHTKGSISILTDKGDLICGDTYVNIGKPGYAPLAQDFDEIRSSMDIIKKLDLTIVYSGHGIPFSSDKLSKIDFTKTSHLK